MRLGHWREMTNEQSGRPRAGRSKIWAVFFAATVALLAVAACTSGTATPVPTQEPSPTTAPAAVEPSTPKAEAPTIEAVPAESGGPVSDDLVSDDLAEAANETFATLETLIRELGPRESASGLELVAANFLVDQFRQFGYAAELQPFTIQTVSAENSGVAVQAPVEEEFDTIPLTLTGVGTASGPLVPVGLARTDDLAAEDLTGKIALIRRGIIPFQDKVARVFDAGAVGAVIYNNQTGNFRGRLALQAEIPALAISRADGERIEGMLEAGEVVASVTAQFDDIPSRNVVAELDGAGDDLVVLGAHYDTVPEVAGANDNGSGTAIVLTLAESLAAQPLPFDLKIIAFGSEELGLLGSRHYVDSLSPDELRRTKAMLNFDAVGTGPRLMVLGNRDFIDLALEKGETAGIDVGVSSGIRGGSSDHATFSEAGVPVLMFFGADFSRIHSDADDTVEFVRPELLGGAVIVAEALLQSPEFAEAVARD